MRPPEFETFTATDGNAYNRCYFPTIEAARANVRSYGGNEPVHESKKFPGWFFVCYML